METWEEIRCESCYRMIEETEDSCNYVYCPYCGSKLHSNTTKPQISLSKEIEDVVYQWLSQRLKIDSWLVSETIKNQMATVFLLVWPILEKNVFKGNMGRERMTYIAEIAEGHVAKDELDEIFLHFNKRYRQDNRKLNKLVQNSEKRHWVEAERILTTNDENYEELTEKEKIQAMIFVVYRYRNNIFHGYKTITEWENFADEIQLCIRFMILLDNGLKGILKNES